MFYTYILYNQVEDELYAGYTADLKRRFSEHVAGRVKSTKNGNVILLFYEAYYSEEDARRRELYFKTTKGKRTLRLMLRESLAKVKHNHGPIV
ncbi:GIY-YIG nuclease family protein [Candidatus Woesebacteria bacterium]|nr:GIY-YIG nuclease family protein [Candidatus Woesebacteria bacterium]